MTDIDDRIMEALAAEDAEMLESLEGSEGVFAMMMNGFKGSMRGWMIYFYILSVAIFGGCVWAGINFWEAVDANARIFWGVWFLLGMTMVGMLKMWVWMDMHRQTTSREIKRLEIMVATLLDKK